ncbi:class I SAM-dependent methyltransferase [Bryobacter aggregatus]|uniref:class I SAM-dependent methyltransferase n=1 Tax=Bryobacter aggregatus TaxID=360054 RepID=UPI0012BA8077|nr:class I SAM-dependent methyltransferase [Bryobacter aggregatus]
MRVSPALQHFVRSLDSSRELRLLDLGGANAANIAFMTQLGSRLYSEDFFATLEDCFGDGDFYENQRDPARVDSFLIQTFSEQRGPFDGALVWDCLQFLRPSLLEKTIDHLHRVLEPGAHLLAYFYNDERAVNIPQFHFKINDENGLSMTQRGEMPPGQAFSNRAIEKVFEDFASTKFFLSRDNVREILVRR